MAFDLSAIKKTSGLKPPFIVVYGQAGVGKTTLGAQAPNPVFLQTEAGEGTLEINAFPQVKDFAEALEAIATLIEHEHDYETLVIDSLDHLEPIIWKEVCKTQGIDSIEKLGYGKGYVFALDYWRELMAALNALRAKKGMAVIMIAHTTFVSSSRPTQTPTTDTKSNSTTKRAASSRRVSAGDTRLPVLLAVLGDFALSPRLPSLVIVVLTIAGVERDG